MNKDKIIHIRVDEELIKILKELRKIYKTKFKNSELIRRAIYLLAKHEGVEV